MPSQAEEGERAGGQRRPAVEGVLKGTGPAGQAQKGGRGEDLQGTTPERAEVLEHCFQGGAEDREG